MDVPPPAGDPVPLTVVHLEDSPLDADLIAAMLDRGGFRADVRRVDSEAGFRAALAAAEPDLVLADYALPGYDGLSALADARAAHPDVPFVMVSGTMGEEVAVECLKRGATDYVLKQRMDRLGAAVRLALAERRARAERRAAAAALRESEERFRRIADSAPVLIWLTDPGGRVGYVNRPFVGFAGRPAGELAGDGWLDLVHPDDRPEFAAAVAAAHAGRADLSRLARLRRADGEWRWLQAAGAPRAGADGAFAGLAGSLTDVTALKASEAAAREADGRKDAFLAVLAHELRNPLAPIRNALHILKLRGGDPATAADALGMIDRQVAHMVRLIDDLLDVSRITRDKIALRPERVRLADLVADAVATCRPAADAHHHRLTVSAADLAVDADPVRLTQIVVNLVSNAVKYTPPGGHIAVTVAADGADAVVAVRDSGIGLTAADRERIFEPFAQAGRVAGRTADGLGVGLSLARRLAELHGGSVTADSPGPGAGSTFTVRLPLRAAAGPAAAADDAPDDYADDAGPQPDPAARPARRVLVVEDRADAADSLGAVLKLMGMEVRVARDGWSALSAARSFRPDVALLDIGLPGLDGVEVAKRLRKQADGRPEVLIAVTGWGRDADRARTREAGFDLHLVKPVAPDDLRRVLARLA